MESERPFQKSRGKSNGNVEGYRTQRNFTGDHIESLCDNNVTTMVHCGFHDYFFITIGTQTDLLHSVVTRAKLHRGPSTKNIDFTPLE